MMAPWANAGSVDRYARSISVNEDSNQAPADVVLPATVVALAMIGPSIAWGGVQSDQDVEPSQSPDSIVFDDDVPMDQRLELTERHARLVEEVRVSELISEGDAPASAEKKFESEQALSAKQTRERLIELMDNGVSEDAAAASLDLYPVAAQNESAEQDVSLRSRASDIRIYDEDMYYARDCACHFVDANWKQLSDLENKATDVVGMRVHESVAMLGGTIYYCNAHTDVCRTEDVEIEDPNGVASSFNSEYGETGYIVMTVRDYTDGPGPCQLFTHYHHAWETVRLTSISIGRDGIGVGWESVDKQWERQEAGPAPWGVSCG